MIPTVSVSVPLQTLAHAADPQPAGEAVVEQESGWSVINNEGNFRQTPRRAGCSGAERSSSAFTHLSAGHVLRYEDGCVTTCNASLAQIFWTREGALCTTAGQLPKGMEKHMIVSLGLFNITWPGCSVSSWTAVFLSSTVVLEHQTKLIYHCLKVFSFWDMGLHWNCTIRTTYWIPACSCILLPNCISGLSMQIKCIRSEWKGWPTSAVCVIKICYKSQTC